MTALWLLLNLWPSIVLICVDSREGGKPEYPEKNPRNTGEINCGKSLTGNTTPCRLGFSGERHNALTACYTQHRYTPYGIHNI